MTNPDHQAGWGAGFTLAPEPVEVRALNPRFKPARIGLFSKAKRAEKPQLKPGHLRLIEAQQLVESELWGVVLREAEAFIYDRKKAAGEPGYLESCMTRDILEEFIARIERAAQAAPDTAAFALPDSKTPV